jgi:DNA polymerase IIIc chi subunit
MKEKIALGLLLTVSALSAQQIILPEGQQWNVVEEGKTMAFKLSVKDSTSAKRYFLSGINGYAMTLDSIGNFSWTPGFDVVNRLEREKEISAIIEIELINGNRVRQPITLKVLHVNRPPVAEALPVFYVKQASGNTYQIASDFVYDPDDDPIVIKPFQNQLPEGVQMSSSGLVTWSPSKNQFNSLKTTALYVDFVVQDQPEKAEARGKFRVAQTQLDLPPEILLVPGDSIYEMKEDGLLNIKIYMSDPNGDDNIAAGGFVASDSRITPGVLKENTKQQSEFIWTPGYKFVDETEKSRQVDLIFYVLDKSNNRVQKKVKVKINDAENLEEKDKLLFTKYRSSLILAKNLIDQLDENHDVLTKAYKQAKKGKKQRAIVNASLGATTGLSPVILDPEQSKVVSGIGGTTVLTLGTLEATEVIGKSKSDILDKMKVNVEIRNQLQVEGDNFARKYALKSSRRQKEFDADREKLLPIINNQKLVLLELDASQRGRTPDNKEIKKTFPDFADEN